MPALIQISRLPQPRDPLAPPQLIKSAEDSKGTARVRVVQNIRDLEAFRAEWSDLSDKAADSNAFYEPWFLLPALRYLHPGRDLLFLFIYLPNPEVPNYPPLLCGMVPFERYEGYRGIPGRVLRLLKTPYNRLCTPLVRRGFVPECIRALLDWLECHPEGQSLVEFRFITGEGRVAQELHQQITDRRWAVFQSECTIRALFKPMADAGSYLDEALRSKRQKEYRRIENRLKELGPTEYRMLELQDDARPWITAFLDLESRGWKGQAGTSLASQARVFFEQSAAEAHREGRLMMLGLFHRDKPIALKCNFLSGKGSFAFKIAFDEAFGRFSPGLLLEIENVRRLHQMPQIAWMDSTADSEHFMINRLWIDRRTVETLVLSPRRAWGSLIVSGFPLLRWIKGALQ